MAKQVQVRKPPVKRTQQQTDAPTVNSKIAKLWFGGTS